jgi:hypothetical protein
MTAVIWLSGTVASVVATWVIRFGNAGAAQLSHVVPGTTAANRTIAAGSALQRPLWSLAAQAVQKQPVATAPRLYKDSLNAMIDEQTVRVAGLSNRVPAPCRGWPASRSGQAPAWLLVSDRSVRRDSSVKREFA